MSTMEQARRSPGTAGTVSQRTTARSTAQKNSSRPHSMERSAGSGRSAGLSRPARADGVHKGAGGGGTRPPRKTKKDIAKDKMIILVELLCGLLLMSMIAFVAAKAMSYLSDMRSSGLADKTFEMISNRLLIIVALMLAGVVILFAGMIVGRIFRLHVKTSLTKKQYMILAIMVLTGILLLIISGVLAGTILREKGNEVEAIIKRASRVFYVMIVAVIPIVTAPIVGGILLMKQDKKTPVGKKIAALMLKIVGALLIIGSMVFTS